MSAVDWAAAGVSLLGAGLAYVGARRGSRPDALAVRQSARDEWGRRFSEAIELMTDPTSYRQSMGVALAEALLASDLAQDDDRRIARALLRIVVVGGAAGSAVARPLDDVRVVEDDEDEHGGGR